MVVKEAGHPGQEFVNLYLLAKRKPQMELDEFTAAIERHSCDTAATNAAMRRCTVGRARKGLYGFGEPRFDGIAVWSFDTPAQAGESLAASRKLGLPTRDTFSG